jgi:hypothetical protein
MYVRKRVAARVVSRCFMLFLFPAVKATNSSIFRSHAVLSSDVFSMFYFPKLNFASAGAPAGDDDDEFEEEHSIKTVCWPALCYKPEPCPGESMYLMLLRILKSVAPLPLDTLHCLHVVQCLRCMMLWPNLEHSPCHVCFLIEH